MNVENQEGVEYSMLNAVNKKYGKDFSVEYFQAAKDATYSNILTLSGDGYIFNAYQNGDDQDVSDDLIQAVVNKKVTDYVLNKVGSITSGVALYANFMFSGLDNYSYDEARNLDVQELINTKPLMKVVAVVSSSNSFTECKDMLFRIYESILSLDSKYIDFEIIQVEENNDALNKMLNNLMGYYDSDWSKYKTVIDAVAVTDKTISSPDDLVRG